LPTTNARKPTKGSKNVDFSLVSLTNTDLPQGVGALGQVTLAR